MSKTTNTFAPDGRERAAHQVDSIDTEKAWDRVKGKEGAHLTEPVAEDPFQASTEQTMAEQSARFREVLAIDGRGTKLIQLFDYLVARSSEPRAPKEVEIAMSVFDKSSDFDTSQDSTVRAYIYRLRQRLDAFNAGVRGPRLYIPKGEYRLLLLTTDNDAEPNDIPPPLPIPAGGQRVRIAIGAAFAASAILWLVLWGWFAGRAETAVSPLAQSQLWKPVAVHSHTPVIAVSDFYMVAEGAGNGQIDRLVMHPAIQSSLDLDAYLGQRPQLYPALHDRDIYRIPSSIAMAAVTTLSLAGQVRQDHAMGNIVPVSKISQEVIDTRNVIYIAPFSQLGKLRSPILPVLGYAPGADFEEIRDTATGQTFRAKMETAPASGANGAVANNRATDNAMGYDYGYIASFPGRAGNRMIVIAGIEDAALVQIVRIVSDRRQLDAITQHIKPAAAFEALFQFRTVGNLVFETRLINSRTLRLAPDRGNALLKES
ncbi:hypothetical protein [Novosphingobium humi]|uniref:hypothetical protein n=1 Tax=Novosphingobium humi TaxID=2282397 RepID=UPI0025B0D132|nr:hypothetical protein [Novosphingobium humi]WJT00745.1 hypothetical protein NYQ05_16610 [Novosphingobium humi]